MAAGVKTPVELVDQFKSLYLYSGNAGACARKVGISETTGRELAREISKEPGFVEARRELRARALCDAERSVMRVIEVAERRFRAKMQAPIIPDNAKAMITIIDKRAEYGKLIVDAHKSLVNRCRLDAEKDGEITADKAVTIRVESLVISDG